MIENLREFDRIRVAYFLQVYDNRTKVSIGHVYDISQTGLRLISVKNLEVGKLYELLIRLPGTGIMGDRIVLEAENRWCTYNAGLKLYESGFHFKITSGVEIYSVKNLINDIINKPDTDKDEDGEE